MEARGGPYMDCCDRCTMHEHCAAWTHWNRNGQDHCWFFATPPPPLAGGAPLPAACSAPPLAAPAAGGQHHPGPGRTQPASDFNSKESACLAAGPHNFDWPGLEPAFGARLRQLFGKEPVYSGLRRSSEPLSFHLGGRNAGNLSCARHARILGSPFPLHTGPAVEQQQRSPPPPSPPCPGFRVGAAKGFWRRFNASVECASRAGDPGPALFDRPPANIGGHWLRPAVADAAGLVAERPKCRLLHLEGAPRVGPGQGPPEYDAGGWTDLEWVLEDDEEPGSGAGGSGAGGGGGGCRVVHYSSRQARRCLARRNITSIGTAGDSVMAGFSEALITVQQHTIPPL